MWLGLQCNDSTNLTFNHQEGDDRGNARHESGMSLNSANGILPGEKEFVYFQRILHLNWILHLNCLDLPQHINCKVINEV